MATFLTYILKWALYLAVLYIPFAIMLRKETFAKFNRILLLGIIAISSLLPFVEITFPVEVILPTEDITAIIESNIPQATASTPDATQDGITLFTWKNATLIYIAGAVCSLLISLVNIIRLLTSMKRGILWRDREKGFTIHCRANETTPLSWFGHIVISEKDYKECGREILLHEEGHIRHHHSWDMFFLNIVKAAQWFNPFIYILCSDLKDIHEYEADRYVLEHNCDTRAYQLLILRKAIGDTQFTLANNFNQSCTRKRITMMARKRSSQWKKVKYLYILPIIALAAMLQAKPRYIYKTQSEPAAIPESLIPVNNDVTTTDITKENKPVVAATKKIKKDKSATKKKSVAATPAEEPQPVERERTDNHDIKYIVKPYYEYINIETNDIAAELQQCSVNRCSIKLRITASDTGEAKEIVAGSCNISTNGNHGNYTPEMIEDINRSAANIATGHLAQKKWFKATTETDTETIYEAHIIFHHGEEKTIALNRPTRPLMVGLTPLE